MAPSPPAAAAPPVSPPPSRLASPALPVPPPADPRRTGPRACRIEVSSPTVQKGGHFAPAQDAPETPPDACARLRASRIAPGLRPSGTAPLRELTPISTTRSRDGAGRR